MATTDNFPRKIREIENCWITLSDGVKLAARIWLPEDAEADPVPAVLEYLPYRKRDGTAVRDALEVIDWLAAQPWCDGNVGRIPARAAKPDRMGFCQQALK